MQGFHHDAHPMGMLLGSVGAMSTFYPDANHIGDRANREIQIVRLIAKMPTLAAFAYRHGRRACPTSTRTTTSATAATSCR